MADKILSRAEARYNGLKRYFTGKPCLRHHIAERQTSDGNCIVCRDLKVRKWDAENSDKKLASSRKWAAANPEKRSAKMRRWRATNGERLRPENIERVNRWRAENPNKARKLGRICRSRRRARELGAEGSYTAEESEALLVWQEFRCVICSAEIHDKRELDHIKPLSKGGSNYISNLQWLCVPCNRSKGAKE